MILTTDNHEKPVIAVEIGDRVRFALSKGAKFPFDVIIRGFDNKILARGDSTDEDWSNYTNVGFPLDIYYVSTNK